MNRVSHPAPFSRLLGIGLAAALLAAPVSAQSGFETLVESARAAMKAEDWQGGLALHERMLAGFGKGDPLAEHGSQFGAVYYRKGLCEMKLARWRDAMRSFETCYAKFPNTPTDGGNVHRTMALLKWGEAAMAAGDWKLAAGRFEKFLEARDPERDVFAQGAFYVNLAVCQFKLGRMVDGAENLEIAIRNRRNFPTPDLGIVAGFQAMVEAALAARDEPLLLDFTGKNRKELTLEPAEMAGFTTVFLKLAGDALAAGMPRAAGEIYRFVPPTDAAIDGLRAKLKAMDIDPATEPDREKLVLQLAALEESRRGGRPPEAIVLAATAVIEESVGNLPNACAARRQLEDSYPKAPGREDNLASLVRLAARCDQPVQPDAGHFLKNFPNSPQVPEIRRLALLADLADGDYAACAALAGADESDSALYARGVADFHLGNVAGARAALDRHAENFPTGEFATQVAFYRAIIADDAELWDAFLARPEATPLRAEALYRRAVLHAAAGESAEALAKLRRISEKFPDSEIRPRALQLVGDIFAAAGKTADAETAYRQALEHANGSEKGAVLCALVEFAGPAESALPLTERFWKECAASPDSPRMALAQTSAFVAGRADEALAKLTQAIANPGSVPLEKLTEAFSTAFLKNHPPADLVKTAAAAPTAARARFLASAAAALAESPAQADAFRELQSGFAPAALPDDILLRLGDHLRLQSPIPTNALPYYEEALSRPASPLHFRALLGRADTRCRSAPSADRVAAMTDFETAWRDSKVPGEREYALFRLATLAAAAGDSTAATLFANEYLGHRPAFSAFLPEIRAVLENTPKAGL